MKNIKKHENEFEFINRANGERAKGAYGIINLGDKYKIMQSSTWGGASKFIDAEKIKEIQAEGIEKMKSLAFANPAGISGINKTAWAPLLLFAGVALALNSTR